jgi:formylglycine-generating enzyme required for sulfatase activity
MEPLSSIAGSTFMMGCVAGDTMCDSDESPLHQVTLSAYQIQHHPVTQGDYKKCMNAGVCGAPTMAFDPVGHASYPVVYVKWADAVAYCNWDGGRRLPTEAEWEYACRGSDNRIYPWGNSAPTCTLANFMNGCGDALMPIDTHQAGQSPLGPEDMAGNASNWVADWYGTYPTGPVTNPQGPSSGSSRGLRAGNYKYPGAWMRCSNRYFNDPNAPDPADVAGFRCAK